MSTVFDDHYCIPSPINWIISPNLTQPASRREREVLDLLAAGLANKEIADRLDVAESTVKTHLENIFRKLDVNDRTGAVTEGLRRGLVRLRKP